MIYSTFSDKTSSMLYWREGNKIRRSFYLIKHSTKLLNIVLFELCLYFFLFPPHCMNSCKRKPNEKEMASSTQKSRLFTVNFPGNVLQIHKRHNVSECHFGTNYEWSCDCANLWFNLFTGAILMPKYNDQIIRIWFPICGFSVAECFD